MSQVIDLWSVSGVLLSDGWHTVENWSFDVDCIHFNTMDYEIECKSRTEQDPDKPWGGCQVCHWREGDSLMSVPLTLVLALRQSTNKMERERRKAEAKRD